MLMFSSLSSSSSPVVDRVFSTSGIADADLFLLLRLRVFIVEAVFVFVFVGDGTVGFRFRLHSCGRVEGR